MALNRNDSHARNISPLQLCAETVGGAVAQRYFLDATPYSSARHLRLSRLFIANIAEGRSSSPWTC